MRTSLSVVTAAAVLGVLWASLPSHAQTQSITLGLDVQTQPDGGVLRRVVVDPYGRLLIGGAQADCSPTRSVFTKVWMDGGVQLMGTSTNRTAIVVSNTGPSDDGTGSGLTKCRSDGTAPSLTAGGAGTDLPVNSSVLYTNRGDAGVLCIGAAVWVGGYECTP